MRAHPANQLGVISKTPSVPPKPTAGTPLSTPANQDIRLSLTPHQPAQPPQAPRSPIISPTDRRTRSAAATMAFCSRRAASTLLRTTLPRRSFQTSARLLETPAGALPQKKPVGAFRAT